MQNSRQSQTRRPQFVQFQLPNLVSQSKSTLFASLLVSLNTFCALDAPIANAMTLSTSAPQSVQASTLGQETVQGNLVAIDDQQVTLEVNGANRVIPSSELEAIRFTTSSDAPTKPAFPYLITGDNSVLFAQGIHGTGKEWTIPGLLGGLQGTLAAPLTTSQMQVLRIKQLTPEQEGALGELLNESEQADTVIALRPTGELTRIAGTILAIKDSKVHFEFDGQTLEMPMDRLAGLTWYQSAPTKSTQGIEVATIDGSIWNASQLDLQESNLNISTASQLKVSIPLTSIAQIRMGASNLQWVQGVARLDAQSDFEVAQKGSNPAWRFAEPIAAKAFTPRFVAPPQTGEANSSSNFDLQFTKPGFYEFRMPDGFKTLETVVMRPEEGQVRSEVTIEVWQDTDRVLQEALPADQPSKAIKVELTPGKKVRLAIVDSSRSSAGTEVFWKQPKLLK